LPAKEWGGEARANNAIIALGIGANAGQIAVRNDCSGTVQFILDVSGYFE
jgi:hypothetical protein